MKISVVIPAFNAERFVPRCLQSVFAQTLQPHEVIVVDDGSIDNTAMIARELGATVISRPNGGVSAARNVGIEKSSGEWIAFLDVDDMWSPEKLERQASCIRPETALVYTGIRIFDDHGIREEVPATTPSTTTKMLRYCNPITQSSVLVRREAVVRVGGFREDNPPCEDWEMWVRIMQLGQFTAVPDSLTDYYVYPGSLSANPDRMLRALDRIIETTLLSDLRGVGRWVWRRRILAAQLRSAALIARDNRVAGEFRYMLRSLCAWPSPLWQPERLAILAASVRDRLVTLSS